jgi:hypothetical protein
MDYNKKCNEIKIAQLERDVKMIQDILDGKIENYTQHPIPILREALIYYKKDIDKLLEKLYEDRGVE